MSKKINIQGKELFCNLRCWSCSHEFKNHVSIDDKVFEVKCPECKKFTIEVNFGKKGIIE